MLLKRSDDDYAHLLLGTTSLLRVTLTTLPDLQIAMDVVSDIVGLSDQKVIEKKTKCFALKDPPAFFYEGKALGTTDKVKILGVTWVFKDGLF